MLYDGVSHCFTRRETISQESRCTDLTCHHNLVAKPGATSIEMDYNVTDAEIPQNRILLCMAEDVVSHTGTKDRAIFRVAKQEG